MKKKPERPLIMQEKDKLVLENNSQGPTFGKFEDMKKFPILKRKPTVEKYIYELLKDSLLTGVPQIVTTSNYCRKFWKILVLFGCVGGFAYQLSSFLQIYWSYPIIVDLKMEFPKMVKLPAITICNYNGLDRKSFCSSYPDRCEIPTNLTEFCEVFGHICRSSENSSDIMIPKYEYRTLEKEADKQTVMRFGLKEKEILISCEMQIVDVMEECPDITSSFINYYEDVPRICYTINARYRSTKHLPIKMISNEFGAITLIMNLQADKYFRPDRPVYGMVAIHSPNVISDPFDHGIIVERGRVYDIRPSEEIVELLPSPFNTNCSKYPDMPDGLYSLEGCIDNCIANTYYKVCGCLKSLVVLPDSRPLCTKADEECVDRTDVSNCNDICPRPCVFSSYKLNVEKRQIHRFKFQEKSLEAWMAYQEQNHILTIVKVIIQHPPVTTKKHVPKYQTVELFSHIGGYVGMWLGMSLIALLDFLEMLIMTLNFCYQKVSEKSQNIRRIAIIKDDYGDEIVYHICKHRKHKERQYPTY